MIQHAVAKYFDSNHILGLGVAFTGFMDKQGRIFDHAYKNGINLSKEQKEMFFMMNTLNTSMRGDYDEDLGAVKYTVTERVNSKIICLPIKKGIIVLMINRALGHRQIIKRILKDLGDVKRTLENTGNVKITGDILFMARIVS